MKEITGVSGTIAVPADKAWAVIAAVGGVDKWAPMITACRVEGSGAGAKRFCAMAGGANLKEVITGIDHQARRVEYRITEGLPVEFEGTIRIAPVDGQRSRVTWYSAYDAPPEGVEDIRSMLREAYTACITGLEQYCKN